MIPRHRPPFGLLSLMNSTVRSWFDRRQVDDVEQAFARWLNIDHAVWIPSARYGIARTIDAHLPQDGAVYCPAFNCGAVFHAVQECQRAVRYVDCAANSFLMDTAVQPQPRSAVVLSEMFGQRFSAAELSQPLVTNANMRIFDMAMSIPCAGDMGRMQNRDVTVLSFGLGKSLFAGWGGLALTHSTEVADSLRQRRNDDVQNTGFRGQSILHGKIWARTAAHHPSIYGPLRKSRRATSSAPNETNFSNTTHEWHRAATSLNCRLAFDNLRQADDWAHQRRKLSDQYLHQLQPIADQIQLPCQSADALSHFCIRVPQAARKTIIQQLWTNGIDAATLFPFPDQICFGAEFTNAYQASAEVVNLPISNQLGLAQVRAIANAVIAAVESTSSAVASNPTARRAA